MINKKIIHLVKSFPTKLKLDIFILFLTTLITMIFEVISIALIVPLTSSVIDIESFENQNFVNQIIFEIYYYFDVSSLLIFTLLLFLFFFFFRIILNILLVILQNKISFDTYEFLSNFIFKIYLSKNWNYFVNKNTAEILRDVLGETGLFRSAVVLPLITLLTEIFIFSGIIILLLFFNTQFTSIIILILLFSAGGYRLFFKNKINNLASKRQNFSAKLNKNVLEVFKILKEIKLSLKENFFYKNFSNNNEKYIKTNFFYNIISSIPRYLLELMILLFISILILYNYFLDQKVVNQIPTISLYLAASYRVMPSLVKILRSLQSFDWGEKSIQTLDGLIGLEDPNMELPSGDRIEKLRFEEKILIEDLNFSHDGSSSFLIKNFNFEIKKNEIIGIIGKSGSGKTTLVNILMGFLKPTSGSVKVDGIDIFKNILNWQKNIFLVQQDNFILDETIRNNITLGDDEKTINLNLYNKSISNASLTEFLENLPDKDQTFTGEDGIRVSGGQKQRLSIARALYHNPEVLILDEATSSLDKKTEKEILNFLNNIKGNKTIILITHREETLKLCNKIIRL